MPTRPRVVPADRGRPPPPEDLSPAEAALWNAIVAARRPGFIDNPGSELLLRLYCQAVTVLEDLVRRASRDKGFLGRLNKQTTVVMRLAKELGLLPRRGPPPRPRIVRPPHPTPPWSA